jgi:threonine dehydrogenase-like Zn-dependent dehydrogenase
MKALVLEALNRVVCTEVPRPTIGNDELLIKTAVSTLCTSDLHDIAANPFGATLPITLGHEGAGVVAAVGARVMEFAVGDRVATHPVHPCGSCNACASGMAHLCEQMGHFGLNMPGTFAEYYIVRSDRARHLPETVPFTVAALFEPICVCLEALAQAKLKMGDHLLIIGDGPFGLLMARLTVGMGLSKVVLAGHTPFRLAHAGPAQTVNTWQATDAVGALRAANAGAEYDAIILATESKTAVADALVALRRKGRLVIFASLAGETPVDLMTVQTKELEIVGACNDDERLDDALAYLVTEYESLGTLVTHTFPLEEYQAALDLAATGQERAIKVALQIGAPGVETPG